MFVMLPMCSVLNEHTQELWCTCMKAKDGDEVLVYITFVFEFWHRRSRLSGRAICSNNNNRHDWMKTRRLDEKSIKKKFRLRTKNTETCQYILTSL